LGKRLIQLQNEVFYDDKGVANENSDDEDPVDYLAEENAGDGAGPPLVAPLDGATSNEDPFLEDLPEVIDNLDGYETFVKQARSLEPGNVHSNRWVAGHRGTGDLHFVANVGDAPDLAMVVVNGKAELRRSATDTSALPGLRSNQVSDLFQNSLHSYEVQTFQEILGGPVPIGFGLDRVST
jgi:hypothetical protein